MCCFVWATRIHQRAAICVASEHGAMSGCGACLHGRKRKCTCGGKVPRKRLKYAEFLNARGQALGFAAASAAAAAAQRAWLEPVAPMGGPVAAAVTSRQRA